MEFVVGDASLEADAQRIVATAESVGPLELALHNAGSNRGDSVLELNVADFRAAVARALSRRIPDRAGSRPPHGSARRGQHLFHRRIRLCGARRGSRLSPPQRPGCVRCRRAWHGNSDPKAFMWRTSSSTAGSQAPACSAARRSCGISADLTAYSASTRSLRTIGCCTTSTAAPGRLQRCQRFGQRRSRRKSCDRTLQPASPSGPRPRRRQRRDRLSDRRTVRRRFTLIGCNSPPQPIRTPRPRPSQANPGNGPKIRAVCRMRAIRGGRTQWRSAGLEQDRFSAME